MTVKVGNVIKNKQGLFVITQVENGTVLDTESIEEYIINNAFVVEDGERKTIQEVIQRRSDMYLKSGIQIITE